MTTAEIEDRLAADEDSPRTHSDLWHLYEHADELMAVERAKLAEMIERTGHHEHEDE